MIGKNRNIIQEVLDALHSKGRDGLSETEKAIGHFTKGDPAKKPNFKAYRKQIVKDTLNEMFGFKCAYCESKYGATAPVDVEHYRPKGAYLKPDGKKSQRGYYWLAAEWTNLLPSCIDCNRERKQFRNLETGELVKSKSGKANKFPIDVEDDRANEKGEEKNEVPLLLDPCRDKPEQHLEFCDDGSVKPKNSTHEKKVPKGEHSIRVYGLDRLELAEERKARITSLRGQMKQVCRFSLNARKYPDDEDAQDFLQEALDELETYQQQSKEYLAMTKTMIKVFKKIRKHCEDFLDHKAVRTADPTNAAAGEGMQVSAKAIKNYSKRNPGVAQLVDDISMWMKIRE